MDNRKQVIVRMEQDLIDSLARLAESEYRSINGEIEYLVRREVSTNGVEYDAKFFESASAFLWDGAVGKLIPMRQTTSVRLDGIKGHDDEKQTLVDNTKAFLLGLPAQNVLISGERGGGKSHIVRALANEYKSEGLRFIEVVQHDVGTLTRLMSVVPFSRIDAKFIIFIEGLSAGDGKHGFNCADATNVVFYATTEDDDLRAFDDFGKVIKFAVTDERAFLSIVSAMLADKGIYLSEADLVERARAFCTTRGMSGRGAKQLAGIIETELKMKRR